MPLLNDSQTPTPTSWAAQMPLAGKKTARTHSHCMMKNDHPNPISVIGRTLHDEAFDHYAEMSWIT
jgi:hypothetical protein